MPNEHLPVVDWTSFGATRTQLGSEFIRILGYFVEDGLCAVESIENAMRSGDAARLILPAHKLKGEARQFGAERLAQLAEDIESVGRACVESRDSPEIYVDMVVELRPLFQVTLAAIEAEANPLVRKSSGAGFGRKVA